MKRFVSLLIVLLLLNGCSGTQKPVDKAIAFRSRLLQSNGCSFIAVITADYFEKLQIFKVRCSSDNGGNVTFEVLEPSSISGITGKIDGQGGKLTFDEHALLFSLMAESRISPVSAPWIMLQALRSGYIRGCSETEDALTIHIDDTFGQDALQVILCTSAESALLSAEIFHRERRILTIEIEDFAFL